MGTERMVTERERIDAWHAYIEVLRLQLGVIDTYDPREVRFWVTPTGRVAVRPEMASMPARAGCVDVLLTTRSLLVDVDGSPCWNRTTDHQFGMYDVEACAEKMKEFFTWIEEEWLCSAKSVGE